MEHEPHPERPRTLTARIGRAVGAEPGELPALLVAFAYFFSLLCAYYILRPLRDEMGIQGGVEQLQWTFTGTFVAMLLAVPLFGWAVARYPRRRLLPVVYGFFIANLLIFYALFQGDWARPWVARAFFIWVSVFNLFIVSVFWSFMADVFSNAQARRLFGVIAAGGSAGAVVGPALTAVLSTRVGTAELLLVSVAFLLACLLCVRALLRWRRRPGTAGAPDMRNVTQGADDADAAIHGGVLEGAVRVLRSPYLLAICLFVLLYTSLSTFLYFEQAHIVRAAFDDPARRTALFAGIDLAVNALTLLAQLFVTARLIARLGLGATLALVPLGLAAGFAVLAVQPALGVLVALQVLRRAGNYAFTRPGREILFTVLPRTDKYKSKNFIDTVVYRGGDALSAWAFAGLAGLGLGLSAIAWLAVPLALLWAGLGVWLGRRQEALRRNPSSPASPILASDTARSDP